MRFYFLQIVTIFLNFITKRYNFCHPLSLSHFHFSTSTSLRLSHRWCVLQLWLQTLAGCLVFVWDSLLSVLWKLFSSVFLHWWICCRGRNHQTNKQKTRESPFPVKISCKKMLKVENHCRVPLGNVKYLTTCTITDTNVPKTRTRNLSRQWLPLNGKEEKAA